MAEMNLAPVTLEHGEIYGKLTVLNKCNSDKRGPRYRVGCVCGWRFTVSTRDLMQGRVKSCLKCIA